MNVSLVFHGGLAFVGEKEGDVLKKPAMVVFGHQALIMNLEVDELHLPTNGYCWCDAPQKLKEQYISATTNIVVPNTGEIPNA